MISKYFPYEYCSSAYAIDYRRLWELGFRGIIFDIDNTLVHHGDDADERAKALLREVRDIGFGVILLSDNDEERVQRFNRDIGADYICGAEKPDPGCFIEAAERLNVSRKSVVVIGDRMFCDILGASNAGLPSIMVRFIPSGERWLGWSRYLEFVLLFLWRHSRYYRRLGGIGTDEKPSVTANIRRFLAHEILFCDISPACYAISARKEIAKRHVHNLLHRENFYREKITKPFPHLAFESSNGLIRTGAGIDPATQYAKARNIEIACEKINGAVIRPGECFSFWRTVGPATARRGYQKGRVIEHGRLTTGYGGGLCNLGNTLHVLALHTPLDVTEVHYHSDALAADHGERVPMSSGTSVSYNNLDLRFKNNTDQSFQLLAWVAKGQLHAEIRCERDLQCEYAVTEEHHRFVHEGGRYYRRGEIYREARDRATGEITRTLIRDNNSEVMFPYDEIPQELIREE